MVGIAKGEGQRVLERRGCFLEGDAVLLLVRGRFPVVPLDDQNTSVYAYRPASGGTPRSAARAAASGNRGPRLHLVVGRLYFAVASVGTASTADSNAMNKTHCPVPAQNALCGSFAGPYAYMPGLSTTFA